MLKAEARWIGEMLTRLDAAQMSPLLNVGSATADFREQVQPWIDRDIFAPLRSRGVRVDHLDIQDGDGIDLRGDLTDDAFVAGLGSRNYRSVLCCNLLEHVPEPASICAKLEPLVPVRIPHPHRAQRVSLSSRPHRYHVPPRRRGTGRALSALPPRPRRGARLRHRMGLSRTRSASLRHRPQAPPRRT